MEVAGYKKRWRGVGGEDAAPPPDLMELADLKKLKRSKKGGVMQIVAQRRNESKDE